MGAVKIEMEGRVAVSMSKIEGTRRIARGSATRTVHLVCGCSRSPRVAGQHPHARACVD